MGLRHISWTVLSIAFAAELISNTKSLIFYIIHRIAYGQKTVIEWINSNSKFRKPSPPASP